MRFGHYLQDGTVGELSMGLSRFGNTGCMGGRAADVSAVAYDVASKP